MPTTYRRYPVTGSGGVTQSGAIVPPGGVVVLTDEEAAQLRLSQPGMVGPALGLAQASDVDTASPAADLQFTPRSYVWQFAASCASAATVTVWRTLDGVTTVIGTLSVPAGGTATDAFEREYGATYTWSSSTAGVTVEVL